MDREELRTYLDTRRMNWPYADTYHVDAMGSHRFIARVGDEIAGLSYAEIIRDGVEARMKMNLKRDYAEYGIGTELLHLLMDDLQTAGYQVIRYEIPRERYAFQIYHNLGFHVDHQDMETVSFVWERSK